MELHGDTRYNRGITVDMLQVINLGHQFSNGGTNMQRHAAMMGYAIPSSTGIKGYY